MEMNRINAITLAQEMMNFCKEYEPYEFKDVVENEEQEIQAIAEILHGKDKTKKDNILKYFQDILEEGDKDCKESAKSIINKFNLYVQMSY